MPDLATNVLSYGDNLYGDNLGILLATCPMPRSSTHERRSPWMLIW
jgi:hypothetical protein